jgi:hypothetical protein
MATLTKIEKLRNDLCVITTCLAILYVYRRPQANEYSFVSMHHRAHYMKTYVRCSVAGDINLPLMHCCATLSLCL